MKQILNSLVFLILLTSLIGCASKSERALNSAIEENTLDALRSFYNENSELLSNELLEKYNSALALLIADSTSYKAFQNENNSTKKLTLGKEYLSNYKKGMYVEDVNRVIPELETKVSQLKEGYSKIGKIFELYQFIEMDMLGINSSYMVSEDDAPIYTFSVPDENGCGTVESLLTWEEEFYSSGSYFGGLINTQNNRYKICVDATYHRDTKGTYSINDDMTILVKMTDSMYLDSEPKPTLVSGFQDDPANGRLASEVIDEAKSKLQKIIDNEKGTFYESSFVKQYEQLSRLYDEQLAEVQRKIKSGYKDREKRFILSFEDFEPESASFIDNTGSHYLKALLKD